MKEQLISFETAKLAKEKGFQNGTKASYCIYKSDYVYDGDETHPESHKTGEVRLDMNFYLVNNNKELGDFSNEYYTLYEAPTQTLLQKWLRKVHNIDVNLSVYGEIDLYTENPTLEKTYTCRVDNWNTKWSVHDGTGIVMPEHYHFENKIPEEALEVALQEALKLI